MKPNKKGWNQAYGVFHHSFILLGSGPLHSAAHSHQLRIHAHIALNPACT